MTLPDQENAAGDTMNQADLGVLVRRVLEQGQGERRLVYGMYRAANAMKIDPTQVMMCFLPQNHLDDAALHIHQLLLQAFCYEHGIITLKVDSEEKLASILTRDAGIKEKQTAEDFTCILLQGPWKTSSPDEEYLSRCYKESCMAFPVVQLPD